MVVISWQNLGLKLSLPLGVLRKSTPGKVRLIHDCSRPPEYVINCFAAIEKCSYQTVQDAVDLDTPRCYLANIELSSAFRSVKIHPSDHAVTGLV